MFNVDVRNSIFRTSFGKISRGAVKEGIMRDVLLFISDGDVKPKTLSLLWLY